MKHQILSRSKGFTLIELLVVIAIIGILAALVLVALGNARDKANDARVKSDIGQLRTIAEVYYDSNRASYTGFDTCVDTPTAANCADDATLASSVASLVSDVQDANGSSTDPSANANNTQFCVSSRLKSNTGKFVCVDASGEFKETTASDCGASAMVCP